MRWNMMPFLATWMLLFHLTTSTRTYKVLTTRMLDTSNVYTGIWHTIYNASTTETYPGNFGPSWERHLSWRTEILLWRCSDGMTASTWHVCVVHGGFEIKSFVDIFLPVVFLLEWVWWNHLAADLRYLKRFDTLLVCFVFMQLTVPVIVPHQDHNLIHYGRLIVIHLIINNILFNRTMRWSHPFFLMFESKAPWE